MGVWDNDSTIGSFSKIVILLVVQQAGPNVNRRCHLPQ